MGRKDYKPRTIPRLPQDFADGLWTAASGLGLSPRECVARMLWPGDVGEIEAVDRLVEMAQRGRIIAASSSPPYVRLTAHLEPWVVEALEKACGRLGLRFTEVVSAAVLSISEFPGGPAEFLAQACPSWRPDHDRPKEE